MQAIQRVVRVGVVALLLLVTAVAPVRPSNADPAAPRIPAGPPSTPQAPPAYESQARRVLPEAPLARGLEAPLALRAGEPQPMAPVESYRSREVPPIRPRRAQGSPARAPATCTVTSAADSGPGTLRQCLSNAVMSDTILFDPVAFPPTNPRTISVLSELPWIEVDGLTLDASNAGVILDGSSLTEDMPGIVAVGVMGVSIRGLQIQHFAWGIELWRGARQCTIGGNRAIGAGPTGQGNVISGNKYQGIELQDGATRDNVIIGNLIGTNRAGNAPHANDIGIFLGRGASGNTIGGAHTPASATAPVTSSVATKTWV
jgi:parallel beta-helix repeat protein